MKKIYLLLIPIVMLFSLEPAFVSATNIDTSPTSSMNRSSTSANSTSTSGQNQVYENTSNNVYDDNILPKITADEMGNKISNKIYEIVLILQRIAKPVAVLMFIVSAFFALLGIFAHGGFVMRGIWGMIIAIAIYTAIVAAPEIVMYLSNWLMN